MAHQWKFNPGPSSLLQTAGISGELQVNYYRLKADSLSLALWEPNRLKAVG